MKKLSYWLLYFLILLRRCDNPYWFVVSGANEETGHKSQSIQASMRMNCNPKTKPKTLRRRGRRRRCPWSHIFQRKTCIVRWMWECSHFEIVGAHCEALFAQNCGGRLRMEVYVPRSVAFKPLSKGFSQQGFLGRSLLISLKPCKFRV